MSDQSSMLVNGGIGSAFTVATLISARFIWFLVRTLNHKRIRSFCCGRTCVASVDVEDTTPHATEPAAQTRPPLPAIHVIVDPPPSPACKGFNVSKQVVASTVAAAGAAAAAE